MNLCHRNSNSPAMYCTSIVNPFSLSSGSCLIYDDIIDASMLNSLRVLKKSWSLRGSGISNLTGFCCRYSEYFFLCFSNKHLSSMILYSFSRSACWFLRFWSILLQKLSRVYYNNTFILLSVDYW